ncbi:TPA: hypothetical protein MDN52_003911 [Klebsiella pneumoniae]|uniref:hypothetical protein n=1 Tax=Klebsiella pneumoniae TaxID=573 RepID=UPI000D96855F|nr:hypothetical protein [Klebsiella pneumoniae]AXT65088.1 hypothetical protein CN260_07130 [Klebsiella pneumoniae]PYZ11496.1 hypothetical protein DNK73_09430 [Klebsiella pneumoniae]RGC93369.1 hypothetical protein DIC67_16740 [Klebsiella pneumoniae]HBV0954762.1 hypothetical protein [Klebsiella pneumoniae]
MTDITELAQRLKAAATNVKETAHIARYLKATIARQTFKELMTPDNILTLVEALEKAQQRIAELEAQNDYFAYLVAMARVSADKAIRKFPQPNYVLLKVAEEAGEVVQAGVHYAENRMEWGQVEGEIVQLLAMLIRLVTEGDQVNGITPPALCSAGIKVEQLS